MFSDEALAAADNFDGIYCERCGTFLSDPFDIYCPDWSELTICADCNQTMREIRDGESAPEAVYNRDGIEIGGYTQTWHRRRGEGRLECWINVRRGAMTLERIGTCDTEAEAIAMVEAAWDAHHARQAA